MKSAPPHDHPPVTRVTPTKSVALRFYLAETWRRRALVRVLASRELKRRHEMNIVGFGWWLLEPLSLTLVFVIVVQFIFERGGPAYPLYVASGVMAWKWLSSTVAGSMNIVRGNANLITDIYFPRALLPVVEATTGLAHFAVGLLIIPFFMAGYGIGPTVNLLWIPVIALVQFLLILGFSYPLAVWGLAYRNLVGVAQNLMRLWFYLSPVIWPMTLLEGRPRAHFLVHLNPATGILKGYRSAILDGAPPDWSLAYAAGFALVFLAAGGRFFIRREQQFGKLL